MKLKVCGMRDKNNLEELIGITPDFIGMIFYPKSPRYVSAYPEVDHWPDSIRKVGVFVNPAKEFIKEKAETFDLDYIQLHGGEPQGFVKELWNDGYAIIKVFSVENELPLDQMKLFEPYVSYFLFDTKTPEYGGSGQKFDWSVLKNYPFEKPFFLSGGVGLDDIETIKNLDIPMLYAIDVNSRFEIGPGLKNIKKITQLKTML